MANEIFSVKTSGLAEADIMLRRAPADLVSAGFEKALAAACEVLKEEIRPRTPSDPEAVDNPAHGGEGALVDHLDSFIELNDGLTGGTGEVGFGDLGHVALWNEFEHREVGHRPGRAQLGTTQPKPFMRPAFDAAESRAIDAFADSLIETIKNGF
jgi:hypothetical protein